MKKIILFSILVFMYSECYSQTTKNINIYRGDAITLPFTLSQTLTGAGDSVTFTVKLNYLSTNAILQKKSWRGFNGSATQISLIDSTNGIINVLFSGANTGSLTELTYIYDLKVGTTTKYKGTIVMVNSTGTPALNQVITRSELTDSLGFYARLSNLLKYDTTQSAKIKDINDRMYDKAKRDSVLAKADTNALHADKYKVLENVDAGKAGADSTHTELLANKNLASGKAGADSVSQQILLVKNLIAGKAGADSIYSQLVILYNMVAGKPNADSVHTQIKNALDKFDSYLKKDSTTSSSYSVKEYHVGDLAPYTTISGARFAAMRAGGNALIIVHPGWYTDSIICKNGIDYYFEPGTRMIHNTVAAGTGSGMITDSNVAVQCAIRGYGTFILQGNSTNAFADVGLWVKNSSSIITVDYDSVLVNTTGSYGYAASISGTLYCSGNHTLIAGTAKGFLNADAGQLYLTGDELKNTTSVGGGSNALITVANNSSGKTYIKMKTIWSLNLQCIVNNANSYGAELFIDCMLLRSAGICYASYATGGTANLNAQKIWSDGTVAANASVNIVTYVSGQILNIHANEIINDNSSSTNSYAVKNAGGGTINVWANLISSRGTQSYDSTNGFTVSCDKDTVRIYGALIERLNANKEVVNIRCVGTGNSTIILHNCVLYNVMPMAGGTVKIDTLSGGLYDRKLYMYNCYANRGLDSLNGQVTPTVGNLTVNASAR